VILVIKKGKRINIIIIRITKINNYTTLSVNHPVTQAYTHKQNIKKRQHFPIICGKQLDSAEK